MSETYEKEMREFLMENYRRELESLLLRAERNGFLITVEVKRHPLGLPYMEHDVRAARGYY